MDRIRIADPNCPFGAEGIGFPLTLREWIGGADDSATLAEVIAQVLNPEQWVGTGLDFTDLIEPTIREAEAVLANDPRLTTVRQIRDALRN